MSDFCVTHVSGRGAWKYGDESRLYHLGWLDAVRDEPVEQARPRQQGLHALFSRNHPIELPRFLQ